MQTCFVVDTNILISDPESLVKLTADEIILPIVVLVELDNHKTRQDQVGKSARLVNRFLDGLRQQGSLEEGVRLSTGALLRVAYSKEPLPEHIYPDFKYDDYIISTALKLKSEYDVTLITNDLNVRVRANSLGCKAQGYEAKELDFIDSSEAEEVLVSPVDINLFYANGFIEYPVDSYKYNQHLVLKDVSGGPASALGRVNKDKNRIEALKKIPSTGVFGIKPKNKEQHFAFDLLLDDDVQLVTLEGTPGAGKSLLAVAAGLQKVMEDKNYQKVNVARPIVSVGNEIGFLPGLLEEKLKPWMQPVFDLLEQLMGINSKSAKAAGRSYQELFNLGIVQVEAIAYIRGKTLPKQWLLIDDAQNLDPHEIKTILTRVGEGTKVILTGDNNQIDNPKLDAVNNGFNYVIEKFRNNKIAGHISLLKSERSSLAELASALL